MKKLSLFTFSAAFGLSLVVGVRAEDTKPAPDASAAPRPGARRAAGPENRLEQMKERLNLTPEQVEKIKPILEGSQKKGEELRADTTLSQEQRRAKGGELMRATMQEIMPILTPEQREKAKEGMEKRRAELEKRQK